MGINYNPYSKDFWDNSWDIYKDLRDNDPVHCMEDFGGAWALSRFEDIWNAHLGSYKDYTSVEGTSPPPLLLGDDSGPGHISIPTNDGADHRDYRNTIADRYTQSSISELEDKIRNLTIEERNSDELSHVEGIDKNNEIKKIRIYPQKSKSLNLAFDVTPARLVTGLITEKGICEASEKGLNNLFK